MIYTKEQTLEILNYINECGTRACENCPVFPCKQPCHKTVIENALALIEELTTENNKFEERFKREARCQYELCGQIVDLKEEVKRLNKVINNE